MKRTLFLTLTAATMALSATAMADTTDPVMRDVQSLQHQWAHIKYEMSNKEAQLNAIQQLEEQAAKVTAAYPNRPEPKIWEGIILSTDASFVKGLSALGKVKKARALLEQSLKEDPQALQGSAHTSLGSLYDKVPGWPIGFGNDKKAEQHLKMALKINPDGLDPNYFYGDFLTDEHRYKEAKVYLQRALRAPARPDRPLADAKRKEEVQNMLAEIANKH